MTGNIQCYSYVATPGSWLEIRLSKVYQRFSVPNRAELWSQKHAKLDIVNSFVPQIKH